MSRARAGAGARAVLPMVVAAVMAVHGAGRFAATPVDVAADRGPMRLAFTGRAQPTAAAVGLKILVVAGEDAVNIIQQKTAVAPIVEVRDRNDLPVAGVLVRFSVGGGRATFSGEPVLSVTTNAAGRATVTGLTPTTSGTFQINVSAAYQGQTATATITQTNFATAAQAAEAGKAGSSSSGAGSTAAGAAGGAAAGAAAAAGGGGGGMSATTIGLIGAGAAGGVFAVAKVAGGGGGSSAASSTGGGGTAAGGTGGGGTGGGGTSQTVTVSGPFTLQLPISWTYLPSLGIGTVTCGFPTTQTGTLRMTITTQTSGAATGTLDLTSSIVNGAITCSLNFPLGGTVPNPSGSPSTLSAPLAGTATSLTADNIQPFPQAGGGSVNWSTRFAGALSNGVVTGTLTGTQVWSIPGLISSGGGTGSTPVTLR